MQQATRLFPVYLKLVVTTAFWVAPSSRVATLPSTCRIFSPRPAASCRRWCRCSCLPYGGRRAASAGPTESGGDDAVWRNRGIRLQHLLSAGLVLHSRFAGSAHRRPSPVMTMCVMRVLLRERWGWLRIVGVATSLFGVTLVVTRGEFGAAFGEAAGLGEFLHIHRRGVLGRLHGDRPICAAGHERSLCHDLVHVWGTLMLAGPAAHELLRPAGHAGCLVLVLPWPTSGCSAPRSRSSGTTRGRSAGTRECHAVHQPRAGVRSAFSVLLLGERPLPSSLVGGLMVVAGVILANRPGAVRPALVEAAVR